MLSSRIGGWVQLGGSAGTPHRAVGQPRSEITDRLSQLAAEVVPSPRSPAYARSVAPHRPVAALAMWPGVEDMLFTPASWDELERITDLVARRPLDLGTTADDVLAPIEVLVGGWGCPRLHRGVLDRMPALRLLAYGAGTVRATVSDELWARGIAVSTAAAANAVPVAELTFAAIVMIAKDVFRVRDRYRETKGQAIVLGQGPARDLGTLGLRVGVVGASRIGRLVIERLATLDAEVAVSDPYLTAPDAAALGTTAMGLDDLCAWADVVSLHAPALPTTRHLLDADRLASMRDGAWLVNTARGSLVDPAALEAECGSGRLCAFIDTPDPEPLPASSPLWDLPNVVLTPHIAGSEGSEVARMGDLAIAEVARFAAGEPLAHPVVATDMDRIA